jgi:hypothetical protein
MITFKIVLSFTKTLPFVKTIQLVSVFMIFETLISLGYNLRGAAI